MTNLLDYDMPPWVIDCPRELLEEINIKWQENLPNKRGEPPDIYIENLARFYSILRDLRDKYDLPDAQITMIKIRDYVLDNLVKKGALVKSINYPHPTPDVLLSIDPFELFDTESLIVVAAVSQMQQNNLSNEPAVILETLDEVLEGQDDFYQGYLDSLGQLKRLDLKLPNHKISAIYGLGERFSQINHLADTIDNLVYNQHGNQGTRTYIPVPFFMTDQGFGVWIETDHYLQFQFGQNLKEVESSEIVIKYPESASKSQFKVHMFKGSMKEQLTEFNQATGGAKMLPAWALGLWMSSNNWDRDSVVRQEVDQTLALDIPTTVIVFEQWSDERT
ncbi:MAG: hypothetical protein LBC43_01680, partial [Bifidobacteriaceae bacterium]|nr:hypothetical protein [Bifidobacteriaceae bacterium]